MSLALDLLEQARHLSRREPRRPRQVSLRRAISAAYYALFHLMIQEATGILVARPELRTKFARAFEHGEMKAVSRAFANPQPAQLAALTGGVPVPPIRSQPPMTGPGWAFRARSPAVRSSEQKRLRSSRSWACRR